MRHPSERAADEYMRLQVAIPSDKTFVSSVADHIRRCASEYSGAAHMYVETAGGKVRHLHSMELFGRHMSKGPPHRCSQSYLVWNDTIRPAYRPLFLPTILVETQARRHLVNDFRI